jgi:hypothetical protein
MNTTSERDRAAGIVAVDSSTGGFVLAFRARTCAAAKVGSAKGSNLTVLN